MSIYHQRDKPAYDFSSVDAEYSKNPHILAWWSGEHDQLILSLIDEWQWDWPVHVPEAITGMTSAKTMDDWRARDPTSSRYGWYNVIMNFAIARAREIGAMSRIRKALTKVCPLCGQEFLESSLPSPLVVRLGIDGLDFCSPCLQGVVFQGTGNPSMSEAEVLEYLRSLASVIQQVPHQGFGEGRDDLRFIDRTERLKIVEILRHKPTVKRVKQLFGSWLGALVEARVLEDGTRETTRGTQCLAKDGHVCYSLAEKTIDDYLYHHKVLHEKEPSYPRSNMRADFRVGSIFIEYFGLKGNPEYDEKTKIKETLCSEHGIALISLYPDDLISMKKMEKKLSGILSGI